MNRGVKFHRALAPYEAGDIAGFPHAKATQLVESGVAAFFPPEPIVETGPDILDEMDRAALVGFGKEHLGMTDEPPADVTDDALRQAIRAAVDPALVLLPPADVAKAAKAAKKA